MGLLAQLIACRDPVERCQAAATRGAMDEAARLCQRAFDRTGDRRSLRRLFTALSALARHDQVLALAEKLRGKPEESLALIHAAQAHAAGGRSALARQSLERALVLAQAANRHGDAAGAAYRIGLDAWKQSKFRDAVRATQTARDEADRAGDPEGSLVAQFFLFDIWVEAGDRAAARQVLHQLEDLPGERSGETEYRLQWRSAMLTALEGNLELTRIAYERALATALRERLPSVWNVRLSLISLLAEMNELDAAEAQIGEAHRLYERDGGRLGWSLPALLLRKARVARARGRLREALADIVQADRQQMGTDLRHELARERGLVQESLGDAAAAERAYQDAIAAVEQMRADARFDDLKVSVAAKRRSPYEALFSLRLAQGQTPRAIEALEAGQARAFLDAFYTARAEVPGDASLERLDDVERARGLLSSLGRATMPAPGPRDFLTDADEEVLYFAESGSDLWLLRTRRGRTRVVRIPADRKTIEDLAGRFLASPDDVSLGRQLGDLLFPAEALGGGADTVTYLIPSPSLTRVPFAAVRPRGRLLVADRVLAQLPSLSAASAIRGGRPQAGSAVVLGDAEGDLGEARVEAGWVARGLAVPAWIGREATIGRLRAAEDASLLHLAVHSGLGPAGAWISLADGKVTASEVIAWKVRPRLAVLASCASGAARHAAGWGSIATSFLAAGSRGVLASLWSIRDADARQLVQTFYQLGGARRPAHALAGAQRQLAGRLPASQWASFVFYGLADEGGNYSGSARF